MGSLRYNRVTTQFDESKRSTINMNGPDSLSYAFINHVRQANGWCGPYGIDFFQIANPPFQSITDADGWASSASGQNLSFGGGPRMPGTDQFAGPYVLTWTGDGNVSLQGGTYVWTPNTTTILGNTTATYTGSGGSYTNVSGQTAVVVLNVSGNPGPLLMSIVAKSTGTSNFVKNIQFYRVEDHADLMAGKVFRRGFKQIIVDYNPYAVRFLDWSATNDSMMCRWENRLLPTDASWFYNFGAAHQPKYTKTSTTPTNSLVLDPGGVAGMPATMTHGELVTFRQDADFVRTTESRTVTGITQNNVATNTVTCPSHGFANGDTIQIQMHSQTPGSLPQGMVQLHDVPVVISGVTTNTFTIPVNTFAYGAFTVGNAWQYITLNVGNRGAYPIVGYDGVSKAGRFFNFTIAASGLPSRYRAFMFHKDVKASSTVTGAWLYPLSFYNGHCGLPIELMTKFINECMELNPKNPINMYYNLPHFGLQVGDQDYSAASDWAINAVDCVLNPSSTVRTAGWPALDSQCKLLVEYANETWNFSMGYGLGRLGWQLWGGSSFDLSEYTGLRAAKAFNSIRAAFPSYSARLKTIQGMFSTGGTGDGWNKYKIISSANQQAALSSSAPIISYCDYIAMAFYAQNNSSTPANSLSTAVAAFIAAGTNNTAVEAACAAFAIGFADATKGGNETISRYRDALLIGDYATVAASYGKRVIGYEGGLENGSLTIGRTYGTFTGTALTAIVNGATIAVGWYVVGEGIPAYTKVTASGAGTATLSAAPSSNGYKYFWYMSPQDAFIFYFKRSQAWADTYITWFNAWNTVTNADAPPEFIMTESGSGRWNHDIDDAYLGGVEGAALDKAWLAMKARNNS